jgi:hypothetical protein
MACFIKLQCCEHFSSIIEVQFLYGHVAKFNYTCILYVYI